MIRKLRLKFIAIAMSSIILVLGTIILTINIVNYTKIDKYSDSVMNLLLKNDGSFPTEDSDLNIGNGITAETPYETRYFTVLLDYDGILRMAQMSEVMAITLETAEEYATNLYKLGKNAGMYGNYKYSAMPTDYGTLYIFIDCTRELNSFTSFLRASVLISLGGILVVFALVLILSKIVLKPVEESYRKQKYFITNASHDIKTPLTIINAGTEVIELEHGESKWTEEIKKQIARLTSLTDKLVFLSKMEESEKIEMKEFSLTEAITETSKPYESLAETKNLGFFCQIEQNLTYCGNEQMICQATALLLDNAMKYTTPNGNILLAVKRVGKKIELSFKNDADDVKIGSNDEIFERFYRSEKSRNSATGGHGIGLSVVKAIVQSHKGKISAFSADGTTMLITITL